jgi:hypothetical protein
MYPDDVIFFRHVPTTGPQGASKRTFPDAGEDLRASVQPGDVNRIDAQGRVYTTEGYKVYTPSDPQAKADDKFEWRGRVLAVVGPTIVRGIGGVSWQTECVETR